MYLANLRNLQVLLDNGGGGGECVTLLRAYMCTVQYAYSKVLT